MLLQVVTLTRDVRLQRLARRKLDTRDLTLRRVRLLRLANDNLRHDPLPLRCALQQGRLALRRLLGALPAHSLVQRDRRDGGGVECTALGQKKGGEGRPRR